MLSLLGSALLVSLPALPTAPRPSVPAPEPCAQAPREHRAALPTGIDVRWLELGPAAGPAVLFLHGYTDTSRSFLDTARALARRRGELRLLLPDQRGHGGSSLPEPGCADAPERCFAIAELAADALALLDACGVERAHVVGHSLGGAVAQELALAHPERVERLVLVATSARFEGNPVARAFLADGLVEGPWRAALEGRGLAWPADAWRLPARAVAPEVEGWLAGHWVAEPGAPPDLLAAVLEETAATPLGTWIGALRALGSFDVRARLGDLRTPTLVVWPIQDPFFPESPDQEELRAALARAHARHGTPWYWKRQGRRPAADAAPSDLGHNLPWVAPAALARDLASFLRPGGAPTEELVWLEPVDGALALRSAPRGARILGAPALAPPDPQHAPSGPAGGAARSSR